MASTGCPSQGREREREREIDTHIHTQRKRERERGMYIPVHRAKLIRASHTGLMNSLR